uniref:Caspase-8 n=1 Tax=Denticeps clupeoides TaxID=299321 RepID=A0AAY4AJ37_9TELE
MEPNFIRQNKVLLIEVLSADHNLLLQHVQEKRLITTREYNNLRSGHDNAEKVTINLLDMLVNKGDERCAQFRQLLHRDTILETFPRLNDLLRTQQPAVSTENPGIPATEVGSYTMTSVPLGPCLIINNVNFKDKAPRHGSNEDKNALMDVFSWLGFEVKVLTDLTAQEMKNELEKCSKEVAGDCFVCCILSHGRSNFVLGSDDELLSTEDILSPFKGHNCQTLAGKPKLFFIQACRGTDTQNAVEIQADDPQADARPLSFFFIPADADILVSYATVNNYYSYRNTMTGSWFIQSLCKRLREGSCRGEDILTILTGVNDDVCREQGRHHGKMAKQVPEQCVRLRKRLIFSVPK